jgi:DNA modification methylase
MNVNTDIYLGDARLILQEIEDNTVDLIVTSPPYGDVRNMWYFSNNKRA